MGCHSIRLSLANGLFLRKDIWIDVNINVLDLGYFRNSNILNFSLNSYYLYPIRMIIHLGFSARYYE